MTHLSIVTISFNQYEFLNDCLKSVVSQLCDGVEYIVVDPGSTDGSREQIKSYGSVINPVFEQDSGPADGLNKGFARAKGDYFYFLNADDVLLPGAIVAMLAMIRSGSVYDVFCFGGYLVDRNLQKLRPMRSFRFSAKRFCRGNTSIFQQGLLFSSKKFREVYGFNKANRTCWDAELAVDMSSSGATFFDCQKKIALFRIYETSITGTAGNLVENQANKDRLYEKSFGHPPNRFSFLIYKIVKFEKYFYVGYLVENISLRVAVILRKFLTKKSNQIKFS